MAAMRRTSVTRAGALASVALLALIAAGCGEKDEPAVAESTQQAPDPSAFPAADGGPLDAVLANAQPTTELVVSPAGSDFTVGRNRFAFGVFEVDRTQVTDAEVAIYAAHGPTGKAEGPYPAQVESLATEPAFTAQTTSGDPDAAQAVYVAEVPFDQPGEWRLAAVIKDGESYSAARIPSIDVRTEGQDPVPKVGEKAPMVHTPTADEVGNIQQIDTRVPPDTLHDVDFADVVGKQPAVLLFATPALCTSRVCGPVVDVAEQVKRDRPDDAAYIHMEIWNDNDPSKGARSQVRDFGLRSEPWLFVVNSDGTISSRIEGAFSVDELNEALDQVQ